MSDLISRQAAIDALRVAYWDDNIQSAKDDPCIVDAMTDWAIRQVKALPSAQPDLIIDIQNGIKATNSNDVYSCGMRNGMRWCISLIDGKKPLYENCPSAQPEPRWIPCSERLPKVGQDILMSVGGMYTAEGCLREDGDWAQFRWDTIQRKDMVGAWQPLPDPYKTDIRINYSKFSNFGLMDALREEFGFGDVKRSDCFGCEDETTEDNSTIPAHWIDQGHKIFKCSNCGNYLDFGGVNAGRGTANYCPNCGAKMWNILTRKPQKQKLTKREEEIRDYIVDEYGEALYGAEVHYTPETVARVDEASKILGKIFDILGYKEENMSNE